MHAKHPDLYLPMLTTTTAARAKNAELRARYAQVARLRDLQALAKENPRLSGVFVGAATDAYVASPRKVLIVGKETAGWMGGLARAKEFGDVESYLDSAMERHAKELAAPRANSKFFQFYRRLERLSGSKDLASVAWGNLFCMDHAKGSPKKAKDQLARIGELSRQLLNVQIDVLQPQVIFFVTGYGYDRQLEDTVSIRPGTSIVHKPKKLWQFQVGEATVFRTSHPQWEADRTHRADAVQMAAAALDIRPPATSPEPVA